MNLPSVESLFECSEQFLQDLQLASLDRGTRRLKAAKIEWNEAVNEFANAEVAAYLRAHREEILDMARRTVEAQTVLQFPARKSA
jgi:hypothetical protein